MQVAVPGELLRADAVDPREVVVAQAQQPLQRIPNLRVRKPVRNPDRHPEQGAAQPVQAAEPARPADIGATRSARRLAAPRSAIPRTPPRTGRTASETSRQPRSQNPQHGRRRRQLPLPQPRADPLRSLVEQPFDFFGIRVQASGEPRKVEAGRLVEVFVEQHLDVAEPPGYQAQPIVLEVHHLFRPALAGANRKVEEPPERAAVAPEVELPAVLLDIDGEQEVHRRPKRCQDLHVDVAQHPPHVANADGGGGPASQGGREWVTEDALAAEHVEAILVQQVLHLPFQPFQFAVRGLAVRDPPPQRRHGIEDPAVLQPAATQQVDVSVLVQTHQDVVLKRRRRRLRKTGVQKQSGRRRRPVRYPHRPRKHGKNGHAP